MSHKRHEPRLFRALARRGLLVSHDAGVYTVRSAADADAPPAEVLLPDSLPLEAKAVEQLAALAGVRHPSGGRPCRVCATPDFHPGDAGIAIGSVLETATGPGGLVVPAAVGSDINCGMRLHITELGIDPFLAGKSRFVSLLRGDYLLGTRDVVTTGRSMSALFSGGLPEWSRETRRDPRGRLGLVDWEQVLNETTATVLRDANGRPVSRVFAGGALSGDLEWAPEGLLPAPSEAVRDDGLATIGRGNHFVEVQVVDSVSDRRRAFEWGVAVGQIAFMVHSGSRGVGRYVGRLWSERSRAAWPAGAKYPASGIFPLSFDDGDLAQRYLRAEATAANYGFVNRALLAELLRLRLREVFGQNLEAPLVYDLPHNLTLRENGRLVARKGACPAHAEQPVIIPGSMGTPSFLAVGLGNDRFVSSASHGAGRAASRIAMGRTQARELGLEGVDCVTLREERRIEEAPTAYKPIGPVIDAQVAAGTIAVVARLRPLLTFKA